MSYKNYFIRLGTSLSGAAFVQWWLIELLRAFNRVCSLNFMTNRAAVLIVPKM